MNRKEQDKVLNGKNFLIVQGFDGKDDNGKDCKYDHRLLEELLNRYKDYIYKVYHVGEKNKKYYKK